MFQYPYGNSQQLNLDWVLNMLLLLESNIAPTWNEHTTYEQYSIVFFNHVLYYCNTEYATYGSFIPSEWTQTTVANILMGNA